MYTTPKHIKRHQNTQTIDRKKQIQKTPNHSNTHQKTLKYTTEKLRRTKVHQRIVPTRKIGAVEVLNARLHT